MQALECVNAVCWECQGEVEEFFCNKCGKIQPISSSTDFFACLGLERKLNFDPQNAERQFHMLSRKFHPDFYQGKSSKEQELSLENASILNKAYRTLRDPISKIEYLIQLELGKEESVRCHVPPDLLEEVLDLHAQLEEIHSQPAGGENSDQQKTKEYLQKELNRLEGRFQAINSQMLDYSSQWDLLKKESPDYQSRKEKILKEFRNLLSQQTYLSNVIEEIKKVLK